MIGARSTALEVAASANLRGKVAVVTGATSGLGVETARALAAAGARLILTARSSAAGHDVAAAIAREFGAKPGVVVLDLCDFASVDGRQDPHLHLLDDLDRQHRQRHREL